MTALARASLLHYESLGLLQPSSRSAAGYRLYGEVEVARLRTIRRYRDAGLSLEEIRKLLGSPKQRSQSRSEAAELLEARLHTLTRDVEALRSQQRLLARLLASRDFQNVQRCRSKDDWSNMLRRAGFSDAEMRAWHRSFETESSTEHAAFLRSLGLSAVEVKRIRAWSRTGDSPADSLPSRSGASARGLKGQTRRRRSPIV